jgi:mannose-6-phosphate isomerase-like protein (cupin superfamily)
MNKVYRDLQLTSGAKYRRILNEGAADECTWHRDERDRVVTIVEGRGWKVQFDNQLPVAVKPGDTIRILAQEWHRVIPGQGDLLMIIKEEAPAAGEVDIAGIDAFDPRFTEEEDDMAEIEPELANMDNREMTADMGPAMPVGMEDEPVEPEGAEMIAEIRRLIRNAILEAKKKSDHEAGYKAPEGSARDKKLDAAKDAYKRGDVQAAIRIRDAMEKQAREKPGYTSRKSKYTDESKQPAVYPPVMSEINELEELSEDEIFEGLGSKTREALKKKAKASNAPLGALSTVYRKGLGAYYSSGSRPGIPAHSWAMARVNSFLKGGKARQVDKAQWKQVQKHRKK